MVFHVSWRGEEMSMSSMSSAVAMFFSDDGGEEYMGYVDVAHPM